MPVNRSCKGRINEYSFYSDFELTNSNFASQIPCRLDFSYQLIEKAKASVVELLRRRNKFNPWHASMTSLIMINVTLKYTLMIIYYNSFVDINM